MVNSVLSALLRFAMHTFSSIVTGARAVWCKDFTPSAERAYVYVANHRSHGDFALLWTVLPRVLRQKTRPVVGADYWRATWMRRFIAIEVLNAVMIEREGNEGDRDAPIRQMQQALVEGFSLIIFPEGTRNMTDAKLLAFKSGIYHLLKACPEVAVVPAWIDNLHRVMPKGEIIPLPLLCTIQFGAPIYLTSIESTGAIQSAPDKTTFLEQVRQAMLALDPRAEHSV
jgi:1-acyl-sn-glycerol-3-phosphate acyltransferase